MMRGQAFDVFKLMIAAVVAVAILAILMGILGQITVPGADPTDIMKNLLTKSKQNAPTTFISDAEARFSAGTIFAEAAFLPSIGGAGKVTFTCDIAYTSSTPKPCDATTGKLTINSAFSAKIKACCPTGGSPTCKIGIGAAVSTLC